MTYTANERAAVQEALDLLDRHFAAVTMQIPVYVHETIMRHRAGRPGMPTVTAGGKTWVRKHGTGRDYWETEDFGVVIHGSDTEKLLDALYLVHMTSGF